MVEGEYGMVEWVVSCGFYLFSHLDFFPERLFFSPLTAKKVYLSKLVTVFVPQGLISLLTLFVFLENTAGSSAVGN